MVSELKATKDEIIGIVIEKLRPSRSKSVADIGFGTGRVSERLAELFKLVYAVEKDYKAFSSFKPKTSNIKPLNMHGVDFLRDYNVDKAFFGGTSRITEMLEIAKKNESINSTVVVNAARIGVAAEVIRKMRELGIFKEALIVNISKSYELAGDIAFKNLNPVFIVVGEF